MEQIVLNGDSDIYNRNNSNRFRSNRSHDSGALVKIIGFKRQVLKQAMLGHGLIDP